MTAMRQNNAGQRFQERAVNRMMKEKAGNVFSIYDENRPVPGCTISKAVSSGEGADISYFSIAEGTDISAESYAYPKLWIAAGGRMRAFTKPLQKESGTDQAASTVQPFEQGQMYITPVNVPVGIQADTDSVYTEISLREDTRMNKVLKAGNVFALKDLLPYQEGKIVNMDLINEPDLKFVIMSFDEGTGLAEHAAPGEALIFALDGEAVIGYEGKEHRIHAGENFKFDKQGRHSVTADHKFKMALLLQLEK